MRVELAPAKEREELTSSDGRRHFHSRLGMKLMTVGQNRVAES